MNSKEKGQPNSRPNHFPDEGKKKLPYRKSDAIKLLEKLANDAAQKKYPNTPPSWLALRKFRSDSANGLTKCIITLLILKGHQAERINSTGQAQHEYQKVVEQAGGYYVIARDFEQFLNWYNLKFEGNE